MKIEALYEGWQLECCGTPFTVGDTVTWPVFAAAPEPDARLPRFVENHHGPSEDQSPSTQVAGAIGAIAAVFDRTVEPPGERVLTNDWLDILAVSVDRAPPPVELRVLPGRGLRHYLVELDVPDDTPLPPYEAPPWRLAADRRQAEAESYWRGLRSDALGLALARLADDVERRFAGRVSVERSPLTTGVTIRPVDAGACTVRWIRHSAELRVGVGDDDRMFEPALEQVAVIRSLLEGAAAGRLSGDAVWRPW